MPVPHFGLAMSVPEFHALAERVRAAGIKFIIEPHIRFLGQPGEQVRIQSFIVRLTSADLFLSNNNLPLKSFSNS